MITWITDDVGTAAYSDLDAGTIAAGVVVDVRDLVDKGGNAPRAIAQHLDRALSVLREKGKVIIACDRGVSRSRAIAMGLLARLGWTLESALSRINQVADKPEIELSLFREMVPLFEGLRPSRTGGAAGVLILGAHGFIGSNLRRTLAMTRPVVAPARSDIDLATDILELSRLAETKEVNTTIFLAHPKSYHSTSALAEGLRMLKNSLEVARECRLQFVYLSSMTVFNGNAKQLGGECVAGEKDSPIPFGTYSESKFFGERLVELYAQNYGMRTTIIRPSGVYGMNMPLSSLIPKLALMALQDQPITTHRYANGLPLFQLVHVTDLCRAIRLILSGGDPPSCVHVPGSDCCSTQALAAMIVRLSGSKSPLSLALVQREVQNVRSAPSPTMQSLGWTPAIALEEGLEEIIADFRTRAA